MAGCDFTFGVYIPSYNRYARGMITGKLFEDPKHVVRKSQEKQYAEHGFKNIVSVDDRLVDGYSDVYNWIVENAEEDVIAEKLRTFIKFWSSRSSIPFLPSASTTARNFSINGWAADKSSSSIPSISSVI